jgi:hypothetical protein
LEYLIQSGNNETFIAPPTLLKRVELAKNQRLKESIPDVDRIQQDERDEKTTLSEEGRDDYSDTSYQPDGDQDSQQPNQDERRTKRQRKSNHDLEIYEY